MGIWAGIKHALNSTLGTSGFKPLDQIMHKYTLGSKQYIASDNLIIRYTDEGSGKVVPKNETVVIGDFIPAIGGYIRFNYRISAFSSKYYTELSLKDETTGTVEVSLTVYSDFESIHDKQLFKDVKVTAGHKYKITAKQDEAGTGHIKNTFISGDISEAPLYDYTIGG